MKVTKISAVTLSVSVMKRSVEFYSNLPNFKMVYGGPDSQFTSYLVDDVAKSYINLKLKSNASMLTPNFGRIIFYVDDVDAVFAYMENDETISRLCRLESKPEDAVWGERFFHVLDPDGYKLSFATPIGDE